MATYGVSQDVIPGNLTIQGNLIQSAVLDNVTAKASGGQATSGASVIPLATTYVRVATVASIADSVTLPPCTTGLGDEVVIYNAGANSLNVFPSVGDSINAGAANAAFAIAAAKSASFVVTAFNSNTNVGRWNTVLSA